MSTMTAAQRQALLEQARQLIAQAEADAPATQAAPTSAVPTPPPGTPVGPNIVSDPGPAPAPRPTLMQRLQAASTPVTQLPTQQTIKQPAGSTRPAAPVTGPGGDTRVSGQPSLLQTMKTVWSNMRGIKN